VLVGGGVTPPTPPGRYVPVWDPRKGVESNACHRVEMVQKRAARWIMSRYQPQESVTAMIDKLNLVTVGIHWRKEEPSHA
jgi:hypothetical protein